LPEHCWLATPACDNFDSLTLAPQWNLLRSPRGDWYSLSERPGYLSLRLRPERLTELTNPSYIGRRQQHINFAATSTMEFTPRNDHECAGLVLLQNNNFHYRFVVTQETSNVVRLIKCAHATEETLAEQPAQAGRVYLKVEARGQDYNFYIAHEPDQWRPVAEKVDGRILSTPVAGGFVGTCIGMYASSNGQPSTNRADFDWFEYAGFDA
jgi:xylan 1,4-beta-xylosidase